MHLRSGWVCLITALMCILKEIRTTKWEKGTGSVLNIFRSAEQKVKQIFSYCQPVGEINSYERSPMLLTSII